MKKVAWLIGIVTVMASGAYIFVYLYRWEWHRALLVGILFVGAELGIATATVLMRLRRLEERTRDVPMPDDSALSAITSSRPQHRPFEWLVRGEEVGVFLPILLGSGIVISAIAWLVEKIAGATARPQLEDDLAWKLTDIALPQGPLVPADEQVLHAECGDHDNLFLPSIPRAR